MSTSDDLLFCEPEEKKRVIILDIDSTLSNPSHRSHLAEQGKWDEFYDAMDKDTPVEQMKLIETFDTLVFIVTGRPERYRTKTIKWLDKHFPSFCRDGLYMRPDGNYIKDTDFKIQKIKEIEEAGYEIFAIFEDRKRNVDAFRKEGWFVFDVAGNEF